MVDPEWLRQQRWFASKTRAIREVLPLPLGEGRGEGLRLEIVQVTYADGSHELYQATDVDDPAIQTALFHAILPAETPGPARILRGEQSNTSIAYGQDWILKLYRRLSHGVSRDLEVGRFLTDAGFPYTPAVAGSLDHDDITLAVMQRFVPNQGDCWTYVLDGLAAGRDLLPDIERLGDITGQLHAALASRSDVPAFAPTPATAADLDSWLADLQRQFAAALAAAPPAIAAQLAAWRPAIFSLKPPSTNPDTIQIHGDYHLGQVLKTDTAFSIIDFEGEPARPLEERRAKQPPIRDVAGMIRSLHYAAVTANHEPWSAEAAEAFLTGWRRGTNNRFQSSEPLLPLFQLSKALYELNYELNNRPAWVPVPLTGIQTLLSS